MRALLDSRIIAGLAATLLAPFMIVGLLYDDMLVQMYEDLDSELPGTSLLLMNGAIATVVVVVVVFLTAGTLRPIGPARAPHEAVRAVQAAFVTSALGTWFALHAALAPIVVLFDKIR